MDYAKAFARALQALKDEGRYRVFADIRRDRGPLRTWIGCGGAVDVVGARPFFRGSRRGSGVKLPAWENT